MHGSLDALLLHQQLSGQHVGLGAASHDELIRRLKPKLSISEAPSTSIASVCSWSQDGSYLAHASDGCVKIWDTAGAVPRASCSVDTGHPTINGLRFFPETSNSKLVTVSADRQARVIDLERMAIRPFSCHKAKIRAVAVASPNVFLTGCEDGVVRQLDVREQPLVIDSSALRDAYCAESIVVEQRSEKTKDSVGVNSIAVDPLKPMFATGGGDPLVRVYDARMMSRGRPMPWVLAYVPNPVAAACSSRSGQPRHRTITSIAYDHTGHRLLASYSKDSIYSFSVKDDCFFPSTLPRELGGPSPRVPSSTRDPGDPARPGSRATFGNTETSGRAGSRATLRGNTEAFRGAGGRAPVGAPRGSAAAAPRPPPRESGHSEDDDQRHDGMLGTGLVTDNLGQHEPLGQPTASPATAAAPASSDPNTGTTAPLTFQTPHTRNNTASGAADPEGPTSSNAGHEAHGEQGGRARQSNDAQGVLAAGVRHREEGQGAHTAGAPHSWQPVQGVGLLQRAFTPFGQALYRRLFPSWQWRQGHAQQHQHQQHPQQHQQQHQHPHQQSPQEGPEPGVCSSLGQLATARASPSRCSEEDTEMEDISGGPVSIDLITHQQQQQQQQEEQGRRGTRRARPSSSPSLDNPSDVQPPHGKRSRLSSGVPRHPSSAPAAPPACAKSKTGRTSTRRPTQPPSPPTQPASTEGVTHAHASPQLHPHHRQQHPSPPLRLLLHPQQQRHQQQRCVSSQDHALQNRHAAGAAQPSSHNPAGTAVTTQLARPSGHNPAAPRWHNPRASGQHVSMAVRVRTAVGAEEPLLLQSTSSSWPNVHPHGPNSCRVGLHRVGTSSQWRADTPAEGQSLPVVPPAARQAQQGGGARSAPSEADLPLERRRTAAPEQAQATHAQEPGEGYGRDQRQSSQAHPSWPWHFRDTLPRQQQRQQASAGVGGLPSERDDEGQAPTRGGATGAPVLEEGQRLEGGQLASGSGDGGGGTRTPGGATREGGALNARNMAAAATAAAQPLNTLNALGLLGEGGTLARGESQGMLDEDVLDALGRLEALGVLEAPQSRQQGARAGHAARSAGTAGAGASVGTAAAGRRDGGGGGGGGFSTRPSRARAPLAQSTSPGPNSFTTAAAVAATAAPGPSSRAAASYAGGSASAPHTEEGTDAALARTGMQQQQQQEGASSDGALARVPSLSSSQLGQLHGRDGAVIAPANTTCSAGEGTAEGSAQGEMGGTGAPAAVAAAATAAAGAAQVPLRGHSARAVGWTDSVSSPPQRAGAGAGASASVSVRGGPSEHPSITAALAHATSPDSARQASVRMRRRHPPPEGVTEEDSLLPMAGMHGHAVHAREPEADQGGDVPMHEACSSAVPITGPHRRLTAQPATRFAPQQQPRRPQQPPLLLNRMIGHRGTPDASGNQGTDPVPSSNNDKINEGHGKPASTTRAARRLRHGAARDSRARTTSTLEPTPQPGDPDARDVGLLLRGIEPRSSSPSAAAPVEPKQAAHGRPCQSQGGRRTRKPIKSRDRSMPYQSVTPHQDLVMRRACLTYLDGSGPQPPPSTSQTRHARTHNATHERHGEGEGMARLWSRQGPDADVLQGADSLGRLHRAGAGATSGQPQRGQRGRQQERGGEGVKGSGQRQRKRRLGVLVDDSSDSLSGDDGDGDSFASGRPMYQQRFSGHRNAGHPKEAAWMGRHSEHVVSGSDDGCVYLWNATNGRLLCMPPNPVPGHVASCIQPHPFDPILATCGSESVVRLWSPEAEVATKLSTSQLATATLNMMEGDNLPEEEPADPMPGVAGWAELVSRHFGRMAGAFEAASPGRGMGRAATGRVRQRRRDTEEETEGRASASAAPTTDAHAAADSDGDQANGGTDANARRPPEGSSPARGSPFPCRFM